MSLGASYIFKKGIGLSWRTHFSKHNQVKDIFLHSSFVVVGLVFFFFFFFFFLFFFFFFFFFFPLVLFLKANHLEDRD